MGKKPCILLVVLDGAGDLKTPELHNKTPLEAAKMKYLNGIMARCIGGKIYTIRKGIAPESDAAVMSLLGYDVDKEYTGRGPLESYGAGLHVKKDSLALRCNFATIDSKRVIVDRRAGRNVSREDAKRLEAVINRIKMPGVDFIFKATVGHRGVLLINSKNRLSANISNADIGYVKSGNISVATKGQSAEMPMVVPLDKTAAAKYTAGMLNGLIDRIIGALDDAPANLDRKMEGKMPANVLLMRDAGVGLPKVKKFGDKFGLKAGFIADMPVEKGIAKLAGMKELRLEPGLANAEKYVRMTGIVKKNYKKMGFIYVHIKGPDEPGHDGEALLKTRILEEIDAVFFKRISEISDGLTLCVTADHSTPCILKRHSDDPVPVAIKSTDPKKNVDAIRFSEKGAEKGSIGRINGNELINLLLKYR